VLNAFLDFNSFNFPWPILSILFMTAILVWTYIIPSPGDWTRRLASMWLFVPVLVSLLLSLRQPIFLSRNLIAASLGYYLLVTGTILKFNSPKTMTLLIMPLLAINAVSIGHNLWFEEKEDWRSAAAFVAQSAQDIGDGLIVFVPGYAELPFDYYFDQYGLTSRTQGYPQDETLLHPQPDQVFDISGMFEDQPIIWLVLRDFEVVDAEEQVKGWLDQSGYVRVDDMMIEKLAVITYIRWDELRYMEFGRSFPQCQDFRCLTPVNLESVPK
jgi:hypothetical protein